jgi:hypothetical protein
MLRSLLDPPTKKKYIDLPRKEDEAAQNKAQMKAKKKKQVWANKKKPSNTEKAKGGINSGKSPALSTRGNHVQKRLCDKEEEMAVEIRDCDGSQHLTGEDEVPKACSAPVCFRLTVTAEVESPAACV